MKKSSAYLFTMILIMGMFLIIAGLLFLGKVTDFPIGAFLTAIVAMSSGYIGFSVANNGVKGKCWNKDMYEAENDKV